MDNSKCILKERIAKALQPHIDKAIDELGESFVCSHLNVIPIALEMRGGCKSLTVEECIDIAELLNLNLQFTVTIQNGEATVTVSSAGKYTINTEKTVHL